VVHLDTGLPKAYGQVNCVEFQHEDFQRAQPHLLGLIHRKVKLINLIILVQHSNRSDIYKAVDIPHLCRICDFMTRCQLAVKLKREGGSLRDSFRLVMSKAGKTPQTSNSWLCAGEPSSKTSKPNSSV